MKKYTLLAQHVIKTRLHEIIGIRIQYIEVMESLDIQQAVSTENKQII